MQAPTPTPAPSPTTTATPTLTPADMLAAAQRLRGRSPLDAQGRQDVAGSGIPAADLEPADD